MNNKYVIRNLIEGGLYEYLTEFGFQWSELVFRTGLFRAHLFDNIGDAEEFYMGQALDKWDTNIEIVSMYDYQITKEILLEQ